MQLSLQQLQLNMIIKNARRMVCKFASQHFQKYPCLVAYFIAREIVSHYQICLRRCEQTNMLKGFLAQRITGLQRYRLNNVPTLIPISLRCDWLVCWKPASLQAYGLSISHFYKLTALCLQVYKSARDKWIGSRKKAATLVYLLWRSSGKLSVEAQLRW